MTPLPDDPERDRRRTELPASLDSDAGTDDATITQAWADEFDRRAERVLTGNGDPSAGHGVDFDARFIERVEVAE